jgi:hypothetical protein
MNRTLDELAKAVVEPDWPVLDQAGYEALPTHPPREGGYFRGQDSEGRRLLLCWLPPDPAAELLGLPGAIPVLHCWLWGVAAERCN